MLVSRDSDVAPSVSLYDDLSVPMECVDISMLDWLSVTGGLISKFFSTVTSRYSYSALTSPLLSPSPLSVALLTTVSVTSLLSLVH